MKLQGRSKLEPLLFNKRVLALVLRLALNFSVATLSLAEIAACMAYGQDIFFAREFLFTRQFKVGVDVWPGSTAMSLYPTGVYLAGAFQPGFGGPPEFHGFLRRYDPSGTEVWTRPIAATDLVFPSVIAADGPAVYVAGHVGFGNTEVFVRKYDDRGNELWSRAIRISDTGNFAAGMVADASGLYLAAWNQDSRGLVRKYSSAGEELWTRPVAVRSLRGLATDGTAIYLSGSNDNGGFVTKYTAGGDALWTRQLGSAEDEVVQPAAVAADAIGMYVGGSVFRRAENGIGFLPESAEAFLRKLDGSGNEIWTRRFGASPLTGVLSLALDASGVYALGDTNRSLPGQCKAGGGDIFLRKYDSSGSEQWTRQFGTSGRDFAGSVAVDATGVYASGGVRGGAAHGSVFVAKLPKAQPVPSESRPRISGECVVNAANYVGGGVAPGEIVAIFGAAMGPPGLIPLRWAGDGRLVTTLAGVRILFNGVAAPILYVSATQSSAIVPYAVSENPNVDIQVEYNGVRSDPLTLPVLFTRPGIFTLNASGSGQGAILNEGGSLNSPENPAPPGSIIVLYATGEGLTDPVGVDGAMAGSVAPKPRFPVSVFFDDPAEEGTISPAQVLYAGGVPGSVHGLLQVNIRVPSWVRTGSAAPIYLQVGSGPAESGVTVAIR